MNTIIFKLIITTGYRAVIIANLKSVNCIFDIYQNISVYKRGEERGTKSLFSLLSEPISPFSLLFEPISPFSLNIYLTFSPFSLIFPPISPSSQLFLGIFSLLPILFLPPLTRMVRQLWRVPGFNFHGLWVDFHMDIVQSTHLMNKWEKNSISSFSHESVSC